MNTTDEMMELADDYADWAIDKSKTHPSTAEARETLRTAIKQLVEKAKWAHHTPALLSDADAAADLAGVARPGAEPFGYVWLEDGYWEFAKAFSDGQPESVMAVYTAPPQASQPAQDAVDDLQGAATWLCTAIDGCDVADIQQRLSIGYNRAKRLLDASIAAQKGKP